MNLESVPMEKNQIQAASPPTADDVDRVLAAGPRGAIAVAGLAVVVVMAIWFAFYLFAFLPRGVIH
jgi:hypothetical protein